MDQTQARDRLDVGLARIEEKRPRWERRQNYVEGRQDLPYAPEGVSSEYLSLRNMSVANWLALAMKAPIQRLRVDGFRTGRQGDADERAWTDIWQANRLDSRQVRVYEQMMGHGRGLLSVWPNRDNRERPIVRVENDKRVHLEPSADDPWSFEWAVKTITEDKPPSGLVLADGSPASGPRQIAWVYDSATWFRFERASGGTMRAREWSLEDSGTHPMGELPIVPFDNEQDADGRPHSAMNQLMPAQDAINTIRFQGLLAMQYSAYRQRAISGYDPRARDENNEVVYQRNPDGSVKTNDQGAPLPVLNTFGRASVDRVLAFPDPKTTIHDTPESNLANYATMLGDFLSDFFARGQVPPQYLLNRMANLSGEALAAAESTLQSLVSDLQRGAGESHEQVMRMGNRARGEDHDDVASEVIWADAQARSFAQLVDAIVKLLGQGFPEEAGWEMLPGATPQKVRRWVEMAAAQRRERAETDPIAAGARAFDLTPPGEAQPGPNPLPGDQPAPPTSARQPATTP